MDWDFLIWFILGWGLYSSCKWAVLTYLDGPPWHAPKPRYWGSPGENPYSAKRSSAASSRTAGATPASPSRPNANSPGFIYDIWPEHLVSGGNPESSFGRKGAGLPPIFTTGAVRPYGPKPAACGDCAEKVGMSSTSNRGERGQ